jgi:phosphoribosylformimino-5-aminoimidazole carboxamide ribonucleotide (ProFAR) isomerase
VLPAIDVSAGGLAPPGMSPPVPAFGADPRAAAASFAEAGARWVHVVDLDLARTGEPANLDVVTAATGLGLRVQASGAVRSASAVERLLQAGAERVVLGSAALVERAGTEDLLTRFGASLAVGIEADGATIRPRGAEATELSLWETLGWLSGLEVRRFVLTEVGRAGTLAGPDLDGIWALATHTGRPVLAAGGIRSLEDLRGVAALGGTVEGAIVGRALYEGTMDLAEALAALT